ncbi:MAG: peptide chain release factor N(5)-glutamine methyltransferase [Sporolactobacillus sp.]
MNRFDALKWAAASLTAAHRDQNIGEILLESRLGLSRTDLLANLHEPLAAADEDWLRERVEQHVSQGTPVQYMLGEAPFYGRSFRVTHHVLIPRPETEELVWRTGLWAERFFDKNESLRVCDIGTGSGAIAITLALEHPSWQLTAVDLSAQALEVARENAARLGAAVAFRQGNFIDPLEGDAFDILVSNPPYITRSEMDNLDDTVKDYEPHLALFGGEDGLNPYRQMVRGLPNLFGRRRFFLTLFEIGAGQGAAVNQIIRECLPNQIETVAVEKDLAGFDRNVMAAWRTQ